MALKKINLGYRLTCPTSLFWGSSISFTTSALSCLNQDCVSRTS